MKIRFAHSRITLYTDPYPRKLILRAHLTRPPTPILVVHFEKSGAGDAVRVKEADAWRVERTHKVDPATGVCLFINAASVRTNLK